MVKSGVLLGAMLLMAGISHAQDLDALTPNGYGAAQVGMTPLEASQALGVALVVEEWEVENDACYHLRMSSGPASLSIMVLNGRIARFSIYQGPSPIRTGRGIGIGDSIAQVRRTYGVALQEQEHEYLGGAARYLTWWDERHQRGIRFETDHNGTVETIHAGGKAIQLIEGCS